MKRRRMRMRQKELKDATSKKQETVEKVVENIVEEKLPEKEEEIIFLEPSGDLFEEEQKNAAQAAKNLQREVRPKEPMAKDGKLLKKSKKSKLIGKKKNV